eukprot:c3637_g1_i3.p1 GENE.c3637_g1_i3~~c3637_g1_i3.p1  ORF type:complete len:211 (+),score=58.48 c3637_g1_i3:553-1185(+)
MAKAAQIPDWDRTYPLEAVKAKSGLSFSDLLSLAATAIPSHPLTISDIETALGHPVAHFLTGLNQSPSVLAKNTHYALLDRTLHVFSEASRVDEFQAVCNRHDPTGNELQELGALLSASHKSCSEVFQCSCEQVDVLQRICMAGGALGSRVTGAGWGGCVISLVPDHLIDSFTNHVQKNFYNTLPEHVTSRVQYMFVTTPGQGGRVEEKK